MYVRPGLSDIDLSGCLLVRQLIELHFLLRIQPCAALMRQLIPWQVPRGTTPLADSQQAHSLLSFS